MEVPAGNTVEAHVTDIPIKKADNSLEGLRRRNV